MSRAIILFAHGARDSVWADPVQAVATALRRVLPNDPVEVAFLEFMQPTLDEVVVRIVEGKTEPCTMHVVPFFIAQGGHLRQELPEMLAALKQRFTMHSFVLHPPLGEIQSVQAAMAMAIEQLLTPA